MEGLVGSADQVEVRDESSPAVRKSHGERAVGWRRHASTIGANVGPAGKNHVVAAPTWCEGAALDPIIGEEDGMEKSQPALHYWSREIAKLPNLMRPQPPPAPPRWRDGGCYSGWPGVAPTLGRKLQKGV